MPECPNRLPPLGRTSRSRHRSSAYGSGTTTHDTEGTLRSQDFGPRVVHHTHPRTHSSTLGPTSRRGRSTHVLGTSGSGPVDPGRADECDESGSGTCNRPSSVGSDPYGSSVWSCRDMVTSTDSGCRVWLRVSGVPVSRTPGVSFYRVTDRTHGRKTCGATRRTSVSVYEPDSFFDLFLALRRRWSMSVPVRDGVVPGHSGRERRVVCVCPCRGLRDSGSRSGREGRLGVRRSGSQDTPRRAPRRVCGRKDDGTRGGR